MDFLFLPIPYATCTGTLNWRGTDHWRGTKGSTILETLLSNSSLQNPTVSSTHGARSFATWTVVSPAVFDLWDTIRWSTASMTKKILVTDVFAGITKTRCLQSVEICCQVSNLTTFSFSSDWHFLERSTLSHKQRHY